jgi:hypothetical protein
MNSHISRTALFAPCAIFAAALLLGCSKDVYNSWYNNPKKIAVIKQGETFSDVSSRLMGQKIDSLGIALDKDRASYQSGPLMLTGLFNEPGHPIIDITQNCNEKNLIDGGQLFSGVDCKLGTVDKLASLSKDTSSGIQEVCAPISVNAAQEIAGYSSPSKKIYWLTGGEKIFLIGSFRDKLWGAEYELVTCDINARNAWKAEEAKRIEDEKKWFVQDGFGGIKLETCKENEGPAAMIKTLQALNQPIETTGEIKDSSGNILETTLIIHSKGVGIKYYRGKARCEKAIANEKAANKNVADKYK